MNDADRRVWVENDEGLYDLFRGSGLSQTQWIRENRELIDSAIDRVTSGDEPPHYLKYGSGR